MNPHPISSPLPVVVGVDGSPESVRAALLGALMAKATGGSCFLVHAAPDYWSATSMPDVGTDIAAISRATIEHATALITTALDGLLPPETIATLEVRVGRPAVVLTDVARARGAGCIVLGGKHRKGLARLAGSTVTHLVRMSAIPVLATDGGSGGIRRVLAAVDLSHAAAPTIEAAQACADLFDAQLRVMHVVEPLPIVPGFPVELDDDAYYRTAEQALETTIWPLLTRPGGETVVRRGRPASAVVEESRAWNADLVVVGSHGKGWVDRLMIGSTSERLLHVLPALMLIVPAPREREGETAGGGRAAEQPLSR